jgi:predicted enzyme related to lactoylglutathione lyase
MGMAISIYGTSFDATDAAAVAAFWGEALGRSVAPGATAARASLTVREGTADTPLLFHGVPETKTVKNRLHLDLHLGPDLRDAHVAKLRELGATVLREVKEPGTDHVVMADPEGNEFCVQ